MDILNEKIKSIKTEKSTKIIPENIKKDVTILNITGTYDPQPTLQTKSITITENTTTTITSDSGYDGLDEVEVVTNISGGGSVPDWSQIGYSDTPSSIINGFNYAKQIYNNWNNATTSGNDMYYADRNLKYFPLVDTSNLSSMYRMFAYSNLEKIALINTSKCVNMRDTFSYLTTLKEIPQIDTSNVKDIRYMFSYSQIITVPVLTLTSVTSISQMFAGCEKLSNDSLNNILASLLTATSYTGTKTLATIGLSSAQATTCQSLSNWNDFVAAGWSTGY